MGQKFATIEVRQKLAKRVQDCKEAKADPYAYKQIQDKQHFNSELEKLETTLESVTPPDTSGTEKDALKSRLSMLREAMVNGSEVVVPPMPSYRQSWDNSSGTPGKILAWNTFWKHHTLDGKGNIVKSDRGKGAIWEAKDKLRTFNKEREDEDPDAASLEQWRPRDTADSFIDLPRKTFSMPKAGYDEAFPDHEPTDVEKKLSEAENEKIMQLEKQIERLEAMIGKKAKRNAGASERMKARWAAKKQATAAEASPQGG